MSDLDFLNRLALGRGDPTPLAEVGVDMTLQHQTPDPTTVFVGSTFVLTLDDDPVSHIIPDKSPGAWWLLLRRRQTNSRRVSGRVDRTFTLSVMGQL